MKLKQSYYELGENFFELNYPDSVRSPQLLLWNTSLAGELGLNELTGRAEQLARYFSGSMLLPGSKPLSMVYAGHQFGHYNPRLGDGRAHLLGEVSDKNGKLRDLHLKGSGHTRFSRGGDGKCALGPAVREFIMSEALHHLGVPCTRGLAVVATGEPVYRQDVRQGAVVTRIASSHIRVGTFQYFAANGDIESLRVLADYTIRRHFPEISDSAGNPYVNLLERVIDKQIGLVIHWLRIGFIHGVMNTDNTLISGETIDFGPCAMMGVYDPETVYSSIDRRGRYAFGNQGQIAHWNIARFAESLLRLEDDTGELLEPLRALVNDFSNKFNRSYLAMMTRKLGLTPADDIKAGNPKADGAGLVEALLEQMRQKQLDYTLTFDLLTRAVSCDKALKELESQLGDWVPQWRQQLDLPGARALMREMNPVLIPRNHIVERVIADCEQSGNTDSASEFLEALKHPYQDCGLTAKYKMPDADFDSEYQTFCGT